MAQDTFNFNWGRWFTVIQSDLGWFKLTQYSYILLMQNWEIKTMLAEARNFQHLSYFSLLLTFPCAMVFLLAWSCLCALRKSFITKVLFLAQCIGNNFNDFSLMQQKRLKTSKLLMASMYSLFSQSRGKTFILSTLIYLMISEILHCLSLSTWWNDEKYNQNVWWKLEEYFYWESMLGIFISL